MCRAAWDAASSHFVSGVAHGGANGLGGALLAKTSKLYQKVGSAAGSTPAR
jgi:hypothetical protein